MSEHLLKILASELRIVRVICRNGPCGAIVEVPIERLSALFTRFCCPVCNAPFRVAGSREGPNHLIQLQEALAGLQALQERLDLQFVIPEE